MCPLIYFKMTCIKHPRKFFSIFMADETSNTVYTDNNLNQLKTEVNLENVLS